MNYQTNSLPAVFRNLDIPCRQWLPCHRMSPVAGNQNPWFDLSPYIVEGGLNLLLLPHTLSISQRCMETLWILWISHNWHDSVNMTNQLDSANVSALPPVKWKRCFVQIDMWIFTSWCLCSTCCSITSCIILTSTWSPVATHYHHTSTSLHTSSDISLISFF